MKSFPSRLRKSFFARPTLVVARELLGKYLVVRRSKFNVPSRYLVGRIVETEAYVGPQDKACHGSWRRRETCEVLWGPPGRSYVYLTYGLHWLLNVVTEKDDFPAAVLIRALEPVAGVEEMIDNRVIKKQSNKVIKGKRSFRNSITLLPNYSKSFLDLANGPAKLTQALGIDGSFNGEDLTTSQRIWIEDRSEKISKFKIQTSKRIGVEYAEEYKDKLWRFFIKGSPFVSRKA